MLPDDAGKELGRDDVLLMLVVTVDVLTEAPTRMDAVPGV